ncbi:MAG TPA: hypothetical protein VJ986_05425 [Gaiellaceae bacterium]|nr:hypothetical protein [Gaiellaceae bacterium]
MLRRVLVLAMASAVIGGVGASTALAGSSGAFLCYSKWEVNPGFYRWPLADTLYSKGFWSPYVEQSVPTATKVAGGYLLCNLQPPAATTTLKPVTGMVEDLAGYAENVDNVKIFPSRTPTAGWYPEAQ